MAHGLLYGASYSNGVLSFTDRQGRTICNADVRKYLTLTATENNSSVALVKVGTVDNTYQFKRNNDAWTDYTLSTLGSIIAIPLNAGDKIQWRCTNRSTIFSSSNYVYFVMTGKIEASNPVTSMVFYNLDPSSLSGRSYACYSLFKNCTALIKAPELPATTLSSYCYRNMFNGCTGLEQAPVELPATSLKNCIGCYRSMFSGCTSLTSAPALPATILYDSCYASMFSGCTSLVQAPALPATTLATPVSTINSLGCYQEMFKGCTSLVQAPDLPATTLATYCYQSMFSGCTSLVKAPDLPVTKMHYFCYRYMFVGCTSLTSAPALPATNLEDRCYASMFYGCTSLSEIRTNATNPAVSSSSSTGNVNDWLDGVSATGDFWCDPNVKWPSGSIPHGWTIHDIADYPQT